MLTIMSTIFGWENLTRGDHKFTKRLNVSSKRLKKQSFTKNRLTTSKTHKLSM